MLPRNRGFLLDPVVQASLLKRGTDTFTGSGRARAQAAAVAEPVPCFSRPQGRLHTSPPTKRHRPGVLVVLVLALTGVAGGAAGAGGLERRPEVLSANFSGVVVTFLGERELIQSWLPTGLELAPECPFKQPPAFVLFGTQRDVTHEARLTIKPRWGRYYRETFIGVPYVKLADSPEKQPLLHFVRLYVDSPPAASQGVRRFGWPKLLTRIDFDGGTYRILGDSDAPLFEARYEATEMQPVPPENRSLQNIRGMLAQPLVLKHEGRFDVYRFDFHFERAAIQSVATEVQINTGFMPSQAPLHRRFAGINEEDYGAFHIDTRYTKVAIAY